MKKSILLLMAILSMTGCSTFRGGSKGGYSVPPQYAKYFKEGHPENEMARIHNPQVAFGIPQHADSSPHPLYRQKASTQNRE